MRKWEDIVRDKMEEPEGALPESVFAEFCARRTDKGAIARKKTRPLVWAMAATIAAGLAALLLLRKPTDPVDGIQLIQQPPVAQVQVDDTSDIVSPIVPTPRIALVTSPRVVRQPATPTLNEIVPAAVQEGAVPIIEPEQPDVPETNDVVVLETPEEPASNGPEVTDLPPFSPQPAGGKTLRIKKNNTGILVAGGGLLAAFATQLTDATPSFNNRFSTLNDRQHSHRMPLRIGLSVKFPFTERLGITTGLEYSLYSSVSSLGTQRIHYLGIPVRLDWTFVSSKWFDVYAGAGVKGDFCIGASFAGMSLGKDGSAFRILGAGGIQFNMTNHLGIYVEPEISWTIPSERRVATTYSSEHPWMFSVAAGLRITLGK